MFPVGSFPTSSNVSWTQFSAGGWRSYMVPQNASQLYFFGISAGGGGGASVTDPPANGSGGGAAGLTFFRSVSTLFLPRILYIYAGRGGDPDTANTSANGTWTYVSLVPPQAFFTPNTTLDPRILFAISCVGATTTGAANAPTLYTGKIFALQEPATGFSLSTPINGFMAGVLGASGTTGAGNSVDASAVSAYGFSTGGAGGGRGAGAGGNITGVATNPTNLVASVLGGAAGSPAGHGASGAHHGAFPHLSNFVFDNFVKDPSSNARGAAYSFLFTGGAGGGGTTTGVAGNGGNGSWGSGGGGAGSADTAGGTNGAGGRGGAGFMFIGAT